MNILDEMVERKRLEVQEAKARIPLAALKAQCVKKPFPLGFAKALFTSPAGSPPGRPVPAVIAEVKKASPSKGIIRADFDPVEIACAYARAGARCLSVLTDEHYFQGHLEFLSRIAEALRECSLPLPLLRKDFIIDTYQVWQTKAASADALLLIVACLEEDALSELLLEASKAELDVLIEVHNEEEVIRMLRALFRIENALAEKTGLLFGINNRDLKTFDTNLEQTKLLGAVLRRGLEKSTKFKDACIVSESGIGSPEDIALLLSCGANAFLVGESLLRAGNPEDNLRALLQPIRQAAR